MIFGDGLQTRDFVYVGDVVAGAARRRRPRRRRLQRRHRRRRRPCSRCTAPAPRSPGATARAAPRAGPARRRAPLGARRLARRRRSSAGARRRRSPTASRAPGTGRSERAPSFEGVGGHPAKSGALWTPRSSPRTSSIRPWRRATRRREHGRRDRARAAARGRRRARREAALARDPARSATRPRPAAPPSLRRKKVEQAIKRMTRAGRQGAAARPRADHGPERQRPVRRGRHRGGPAAAASATRSPAPRTPAARTTRRASSCTGPGFRAEGLRLAQDLDVKVVGPLDGVRRGRAARRPARRRRRRLSAQQFGLPGVHELQRRGVVVRCSRGSSRRAPWRG